MSYDRMGLSNRPDDPVESHGCDSCGHEMWGFTRPELTKQGWRWHDDNGATFVMCDECEADYAARRMDRARRAAA